jgi:hypothetical protein
VTEDWALVNDVQDHVWRHLGPYDLIYHESGSRHVHVDVHVVPPGPGRPFQVLATSGMSQRPMTVPDGMAPLSRAELTMCLPPDWRLDAEGMRWPVDELRGLARLPHERATWLGVGHTVNGRGPLAPDTGLCAWLLHPSLLLSTQWTWMDRPNGARTLWLAAVPIYREELELARAAGSEALLARFDRHGVTDLFDLHRPNVATSRRWSGRRLRPGR